MLVKVAMLGATPYTVWRSVVRNALVLVVLGGALGLLGGFGVSRFVASLLHGVGKFDADVRLSTVSFWRSLPWSRASSRRDGRFASRRSTRYDTSSFNATSSASAKPSVFGGLVMRGTCLPKPC